MKPITSVIICGDINPDDLGGAEVHIVEVVKGLAGRGHTCHVFVGNDDRIKKIWNWIPFLKYFWEGLYLICEKVGEKKQYGQKIKY